MDKLSIAPGPLDWGCELVVAPLSVTGTQAGERRGLDDDVSLGRVRGTTRTGVPSGRGPLGLMAPGKGSHQALWERAWGLAVSDDGSWIVGVETASGHRQPFLAVLTFWESRCVSLQLSVPDRLGVSTPLLVDVDGSCRVSGRRAPRPLPGLAEAAKRSLLLLVIWQS